MLGRASNPEALGFLSGEVSLASKPEELLIAIAHRCRKLIKNTPFLKLENSVVSSVERTRKYVLFDD